MSTIKETLLQAAVEYGEAVQLYNSAIANGCPDDIAKKLRGGVFIVLTDLQAAADDYFNDTFDGAE